jgi:hypothetical protein
VSLARLSFRLYGAEYSPLAECMQNLEGLTPGRKGNRNETIFPLMTALSIMSAETTPVTNALSVSLPKAKR